LTSQLHRELALFDKMLFLVRSFFAILTPKGLKAIFQALKSSGRPLWMQYLPKKSQNFGEHMV
jgi:hypothetical protein